MHSIARFLVATSGHAKFWLFQGVSKSVQVPIRDLKIVSNFCYLKRNKELKL